MGGDGLSVLGIRRVLHGGEILHIHIVRHNHQAAGMLARGAPHAHAAQGQAIHLRIAGSDLPLLQVLAHKAVGSLFCQSADGTGSKHLCLAEHLHRVAMGPGLVFPGEVQVDIRHLAAAVAQKGLKGDVKPVLHQLFPALGAAFVRHIRTAAIAAVGDELRVLAPGTAVVGRQRVHLRDTRHIGNQR